MSKTWYELLQDEAYEDSLTYLDSAAYDGSTGPIQRVIESLQAEVAVLTKANAEYERMYRELVEAIAGGATV